MTRSPSDSLSSHPASSKVCSRCAVGARDFRDAAVLAGPSIVGSVTITETTPDLSPIYTALRGSGARVVFLACQSFVGRRIMLGADAEGLVGEGYLWFAGFSVGSGFYENSEILMADDTLRLRVLKGMFAMNAFTGEGTYVFEQYMARRRVLPSTQGDVNGTCNLEQDDDGHEIW